MSVLVRLEDGVELVDVWEVARRWRRPVWVVYEMVDCGLLDESGKDLQGFVTFESVVRVERSGVHERW